MHEETSSMKGHDTTGTVTISERPGAAAWDMFFRLRDETDVPSDFLAERPLNSPARSGCVFDDRTHVKNTNPDQLCISVITRAELRYGVERKPDAKRLALLVDALLDMIRVLPWEAGAADWYAKVAAQLDASGTPIGVADTMIAAHAIDAKAILVTNNTRHYDRIKVRSFKHVNWTEDKPAGKKVERRMSKK